MPRKPNLDTLEATARDAAPLEVPPEADVTIKYKRGVDDSALRVATASRYSEDLQELASEEFPEGPTDPLSEFIAEWHQYSGYTLKIVRLPDPAQRRMPGQAYNRSNLGAIEQLGDMVFDPNNLVGSIQIINGNSGGVFRFWLTDENGAPIPGARVESIAIADPPKQFNPARDFERERYSYREPQQPAKPEPSEFEIQMQELQKRLLQNALTRMMEPPPAPAPPPATNPIAALPIEDQVALYIIQRGDVLPGVMSKLSALAGAPEAAAAKESISDRLINAGLHIAETNPAIVERVSSTIERIVARVLPEPQRAPQQQQPYQGGRIEQPMPQLAPANIYDAPPTSAHPTGLPEAPESEDDEDEDIMDILDELFTLLTGNAPLTADNPVFDQLAQDYPLKFRGAVRLLATLPLDSVIAWIADKSPLYTSMLNSPATGAHYRQRLAELQTLCRTATQPQPTQPTPAPAPVDNDNTQDNEAPEA